MNAVSQPLPKELADTPMKNAVAAPCASLSLLHTGEKYCPCADHTAMMEQQKRLRRRLSSAPSIVMTEEFNRSSLLETDTAQLFQRPIAWDLDLLSTEVKFSFEDEVSIGNILGLEKEKSALYWWKVCDELELEA